MKNIFAYGSLMYDEVWECIVSGSHDKIIANLAGYRRLKVKEEEYPAIVKGNGWIQGIVRLAVEDEDIAKLDMFEADFYERVTEQVQDLNGVELTVEVYRTKKECQTMLEEADWDKDHFEKSGLQKFIQKYTGFQRMPD